MIPCCMAYVSDRLARCMITLQRSNSVSTKMVAMFKEGYKFLNNFCIIFTISQSLKNKLLTKEKFRSEGLNSLETTSSKICF